MRIKQKTADLFRAILQAFRPPPDLTVSEWAAQYRYIAASGAAEPGKWRNERVPHLVEIMDAMGDLKTPVVVGMLASQTGKSEACINTIGRFVHLDPTSLLMIQPTENGGKDFSKERIAPTIRDTPALRERIASPKTRDGDNTILVKHFAGGFLAIVGSNAPHGLASRPVRVVIADEVDRYQASAGTEGDPVSLAEKRSTTFWNRKLIMISTPGDAATSRIEPAYLASTMERWHLPCPHCGEYQPLEWSGLLFKDLPKPVYHCSKCGETGSEHAWKNGAGRWIAENPECTTRGFHTTALVSFFIDWPELVREWQLASVASSKGNYELLKTFINTRLAETWLQPGEEVEEQEVMKRKEPYFYQPPGRDPLPCDVPDGVLILTAGVDIQENRAEVEVVGWGSEWESWGIEYHVVMGDPTTKKFWNDLDEYLQRKWRYGDGREVGITTACVDSGYLASDVYNFTKPRQSRRIYATKGQGGIGVPMIARATQNTRNRAVLFILGVDEIKGKVLANLKVHTPGPGYSHFPLCKDLDEAHRRGYTDEYFRGLISERRVIKFHKGFKRYEWQKITGVRNEPLDCRVYARAALAILNPDFEALRRLKEKTRKTSGGGQKKTAAPTGTQRPRRRRGSKGVTL